MMVFIHPPLCQRGPNGKNTYDSDISDNFPYNLKVLLQVLLICEAYITLLNIQM